ncbi:MAG TPA: hypothetical protein VLH81_10960, partial [Desulfobacterales bacterium]|nr:hypothetical protein [Desulfobacterales bacterium]
SGCSDFRPKAEKAISTIGLESLYLRFLQEITKGRASLMSTLRRVAPPEARFRPEDKASRRLKAQRTRRA